MRQLKHIPVPVFSERKAHGMVYLAGFACARCAVPCPSSSFCYPAIAEARKRILETPKRLVARVVSELTVA